MNAQILHFEAYRNCTSPTPQQPSGIRVIDQDRYLEIVTGLPNCNQADVFIGILDGVLTIGAKIEVEEEHNIGGIMVIDHTEKTIEQSFALPDSVDTKDIHATYDGADLRIVIIKRKTKKIEH